MLDAKLLRNHLDEVASSLSRRGFVLDSEAFTLMEGQRKTLQKEVESLQEERNRVSKKIGVDKAAGVSTDSLYAEMKEVSLRLKTQDQLLGELNESMRELLISIPNVPDQSVPVGQDESDNTLVREWGKPKTYDFDVQDHLAIGLATGLMDPERASKMSGARFMVLWGQLAKLHRSIAQFMLDFHVKHHGYQEVMTPFLVNREALYGTGQLPKMDEDLFHIQGYDLSLIPTAEVSLTNLYQGEILDHETMPRKLVALTPCFRSEAGSYGKDTKGLIRQHQFEKVELVQIVSEAQASEAHEQLTQHAESILQTLELPYRVMNLCTGDLGFSACKTYDLEVWLPGQNAYREISSCSHFSDFQARRLQLRLRSQESKKPVLAHTVNGSGLAVGRTLVAVLENNQQKDGSVQIPDALVPYFGAEILTACES